MMRKMYYCTTVLTYPKLGGSTLTKISSIIPPSFGSILTGAHTGCCCIVVVERTGGIFPNGPMVMLLMLFMLFMLFTGGCNDGVGGYWGLQGLYSV